MKHYRPTVNSETLTAASVAPVIACPVCNAVLAFHRSRTPQIDACGFESYRLECEKCGAPFAGIVDSCDDTLLLSEVAARK